MPQFILLSGKSILVFLGLFYVTSYLFLICGLSLSAWSFFLALGLTLVFLWRKAREPGLLVFLVLLLSICFSVLFAKHFFDTSYDGQVYHQEAVYQLASGWNPLYDPEITGEDLGNSSSEVGLYLNHYPLFTWGTAAVVYKLVGSIEAAKALDLLLLLACFCIAFALLSKKLNLSKKFSFVFALLVAANPVAIVQLTNFYIDGQLASIVPIALCAYLLADKLLLFLAIVIAVNIKFTGLVIVGGLLGGLMLWQRMRHFRFVFISFFFAIFIFGFFPYVTNTLRHSNPIYPVKTYDLSGVTMPEQTLSKDQLPGNFRGLNRFEKLFYSLFSRSENILEGQSSTLKYPLLIDGKEIEVFSFPDVRIAGFGPLFSAALVFSLSLLLFLPIKFALFSFFLLFIALINAESWWARYVSHLWLIPLVSSIVIFSKNSSKKFERFLATTVVLLLLINSSLIVYTHLSKQNQFSGLVRANVNQLVAKGEKIEVDFRNFRANRIRLSEFGIDFIETANLTCSQPRALAFSHALYCLK